MNDEALNIGIRKFLKMVGVNAQREVERAVANAVADGTIAGDETLKPTMTLRIDALKLDVTWDGELRLED